MTKIETGYEWLDHTADAAAVIRGETIEALFEAAATALTDLITDRNLIAEQLEQAIELRAADREQLLIHWLNEILARFEIDGTIFRRFHVERVERNRLLARAWGEAFDPHRHPFRTAVKAATYHQLALKRSNGGWEATVIFDI